MNRYALALAIFALAVPDAARAGPKGDPRSSYRIDVKLDHAARALHGRANITYRNTTSAPLGELLLHLYPNAYAPNTVFARDRHKLPFYADPLTSIPDDDNPGSLAVRSVSSEGGALQFSVDETIMRIVLAQPLQPEARMEMEILFDVAVPDFRDRFGRRGASYAISGWFPKLAVLDEKGWHATQFRGIGEFYSEPADYDVTITTPPGFVIGATGERVDSTIAQDRASITRWHARRVRDFAWVADPAYHVRETQWNGVTVRYLHFARDSAVAERGLTYAVQALTFFSARYGQYPYSTLTVAESAAIGTGLGVEYPQLVMISLDLHRSALNATALEEVVVHEVAHQWWYGMVGNDEAEEAWLDEGFASYSTRQFLNDKHGSDVPIFRWPRRFAFLPTPSKTAIERLMYANQARAGFDREVLRPAAEFDDIQSYVVAIYYKASFVLDMLEYLVGREQFATILRTYSEGFRDRNATTTDFIDVAESVTGRSLAEFFRQWLETTDTCDYGVEDVSTERTSAGEHIAIITVRRLGRVAMPVQVRITLADGNVLWREWDGAAESERIEVRSATSVRAVELDPEHRILETNRVNNHHPRKFARTFNPFSWNEDAYSVTHLPYAWFDDGLELGLLLQGGYPGTASFPAGVRRPAEFRMFVAHNLGTDRSRVSGFVGAPLPGLGLRASWGVSGMHSTGRTRAELETRWILGDHMYRAPYQWFGLSLLHDEWSADGVCSDIRCERGSARRVRLSYGFNRNSSDYYPVKGGAFDVSLEGAPAALGSDWSFARASLSAQLYRRLPNSLLAVHVHHASASGGTPRQEQPSLRYDANFHAEGFHRIVARHISAVQAELRIPLGRTSGTAVAVFGKAAHSEGSTTASRWSGESGVGLRLFGNAPFAVQIDIPLGISGAPASTDWSFRRVVVRSGRPFKVRNRD
jgi:hypothetical protein